MNEASMAYAMDAPDQSFESLVLEYFNQVLSYLHRIVGDIAEAHRLTETTFAEMARYYRKGKTPNHPRALLFLLATARAREFLKKGNKRGLVDRLFKHEAEPVVEFGEEDIRGLANDTSQRALSTLEFNDKAVLLLHDYCGLSYDEVARAAGIGRSAVGRDLERARQSFKQAYDYIKF